MKKLLLGLGSMAVVAAPVALAVSCGSGDEVTGFTMDEIKALNLAHQTMWQNVEGNTGNTSITYRVNADHGVADASIKTFISAVEKTITEIEESSTEANTAFHANTAVTNAIAYLNDATNPILGKAAVANHLHNLTLPYIAKYVNPVDAEAALIVLIGVHNTSNNMHVVDHATFETYKAAADATILAKTTSLEDAITANAQP